MIIFNYPDRCPKCESTNIIPAMIDPGENAEVPKGQQPFLCSDCSALWAEKLITSREYSCQVAVLGGAWMVPKAILVDHRAEDPRAQARALLGIPPDVDHVVMPIQKVLDDGHEQAELVRKGGRTLWTPPSAGGQVRL